ncbi:hypothetical protein CDAR_270801 [Caerostris darwini]|uniref:Uncharacterized protein n=1 Tax=Caerostris darwini TaxID=1538125 RepID=A0AAV4THV9_9ARAC|nr:hypothetical protein CDAR_270801 [Caerostris darwini]
MIRLLYHVTFGSYIPRSPFQMPYLHEFAIPTLVIPAGGIQPPESFFYKTYDDGLQERKSSPQKTVVTGTLGGPSLGTIRIFNRALLSLKAILMLFVSESYPFHDCFPSIG